MDLAISGVVTLSLLLLLLWAIRRSPATAERAMPTGAALILAGWCAAYAAMLVALRTMTRFDELCCRLLLPMLPIVTILAMGWIRDRLQPSFRGSAAVIACAALACAHTATAYGRPRDGFGSPIGLARAAEIRTLATELGATRLFSDRVVEVHAALEVPVHWLPIPESLPALVEARPPAARDVVVIEDGGAIFPCPSYQEAYERLLAGMSDIRARTRHFRAYRLVRSPPAASALDVTQTCSPGSHRIERARHY